MLLYPLDHVLGTLSKVRLLRALAPLAHPVSGRQATRLARISRQGIRALDELSTAGILTRRETAGQHLYAFNHQNRLAPVVLGLFEAEHQRTSALFEDLERRITDAGGAASALIYGSSARGDGGPASDLDVLVVTENRGSATTIHDALASAYEELDRVFGVDLSPVVISLPQARRQHAAGDPFIASAVREGRLICGSPLEDLLRG